MGWKMRIETFDTTRCIPVLMEKVPKDIKFAGFVPDINIPDPITLTRHANGTVIYSVADDTPYVYIDGKFESLRDNGESDNKKDSVKIHRRTNCCNCGAVLPDTSDSKVKCLYCDTVQSIDKDNQEVLNDYQSCNEDFQAKADYINYHIDRIERINRRNR